MSRHITLTAPAQIEAYLHRTRMRMLAALADGPATVSLIAARLGVHPANLTRHIRLLRKAGLVNLVETRDTGRNLEKWYASTAQSYDVAPEADGLEAPHKTALAFARSDLSAALARLPDEDPGAVQVLMVEARLTPEQVKALAAELSRVAARVQARGARRAGRRATPQRLVLALYPAGEDESWPAREIRLSAARRKRTGK
jgi:DNA-binding transcriptional ArsR family regulator